MTVTVDIIPLPGLITDQQQPTRPDGTAAVDLNTLVEAGFEWLSYLLVDGAAIKPIDIAKFGRTTRTPFKSVGAWGGVYNTADFLAFGERFGRACVNTKADHAIVDAELCAKGTRGGQKMQPIIDGMRFAGWTGPVHLCPLGAPVNARPHGPNDFAVDTKSFTDTGGGLLPQAYFNAFDEYRPDLCVDYWVACGVPRDRINVMVELAVEGAKMQKITGADWVPLLQAAGVKRNFSVYMVQHGTDLDWAGLEQLAKATPAPAPTPQPTPIVDPAGCNRNISREAHLWLDAFPNDPKPLTRLRLIARASESTDPQWNHPAVVAARKQLAAAFDTAGIPTT